MERPWEKDKVKNLFASNIRKAYLFRFLVLFHLVGGVLVPFFTDWGGLTLTQTLLIQSWYVIWAFLLEIPTGAVSDYIGRKPALSLGAIVGAVAALVYSSIPTIPIFLFAEFLFAASFALFSGTDEAFLYDSLETVKKQNEINKVVARYESMGLVGLMVAAPIGSLIASLLGPRFSMMLMVIPLFLAFLVGLTFKEPQIKKPIQEPTRYLDILKQGLQIIKERKKIQWIIIDLSAVHSLSFLMVWLYQPLLGKLGVNIGWFGLVAAANTGAQILLMSSYPALERKLGGVGRLLSLTALMPGLLFIIAGSTAFIPAVVGAIVLAEGFGLTRRPLVSEELNRMIPSAQRATVLSAVMILRRLFSAGLNPIVGKLADWSLSYTLVLIGVALLCFSGFRQVVLATYRRRRTSATGRT